MAGDGRWSFGLDELDPDGDECGWASASWYWSACALVEGGGLSWAELVVIACFANPDCCVWTRPRADGGKSKKVLVSDGSGDACEGGPGSTLCARWAGECADSPPGGVGAAGRIVRSAAWSEPPSYEYTGRLRDVVRVPGRNGKVYRVSPGRVVSRSEQPPSLILCWMLFVE